MPEASRRARGARWVSAARASFFVYAGGISPHKGLATLLDAFATSRRASCRRRGSSSPARSRTRSISRRRATCAGRSTSSASEGASCSPGHVSDETLACLYAGALAFVSPSMSEGFGLPAVEAAASGTAVVLSDIPAHRESHRRRGALLPVGDVRGARRAARARSSPTRRCASGLPQAAEAAGAAASRGRARPRRCERASSRGRPWLSRAPLDLHGDDVLSAVQLRRRRRLRPRLAQRARAARPRRDGRPLDRRVSGARRRRSRRPSRPSRASRVHRSRAGRPRGAALASYLTGRPAFYARELTAVLEAKRVRRLHFHNVSLVGGPGRPPLRQRREAVHDARALARLPDARALPRQPRAVRRAALPPLHAALPPAAAALALLGPARALDRRTSTCSSRRAGSRSRRTARAGFTRPMRLLPPFVAAGEVATSDARRRQRRPAVLPVRRTARAAEGRAGAARGVPRRSATPISLVAGDGTFGAELRRRAAGLDHVRFLGHVDAARLGALYAGATALVIPSIGYETFGMVGVEAMARGTPVIVNDLGAAAGARRRLGRRARLSHDRRARRARCERLLGDPALRRRARRSRSSRVADAVERGRRTSRGISPRSPRRGSSQRDASSSRTTRSRTARRRSASTPALFAEHVAAIVASGVEVLTVSELARALCAPASSRAQRWRSRSMTGARASPSTPRRCSRARRCGRRCSASPGTSAARTTGRRRPRGRRGCSSRPRTRSRARAARLGDRLARGRARAARRAPIRDGAARGRRVAAAARAG